jgi:trimethylguanosine synthase
LQEKLIFSFVMEEKFSKNIFADRDAYYMSCPEVVAEYIADRLSCFDSAVELCCAVGMTTVQLARRIRKVVGIDCDERRIEDARRNARLYGVENAADFIVGDVLDKDLLEGLSADVVVLDPDWSMEGDDKSVHVDGIDCTQPSLRDLFRLAKRHIARNIVIRVPKHFNHDMFSEFGYCELETIIWSGKPRFKVAYFFEDCKENTEIDISFD